MNSTITITPVSNIKQGTVIDNSLVTSETHDSDMKVFEFYNFKTKTKWMGNLMHVSLYDDLIIKEGVEYKILHMLSK